MKQNKVEDRALKLSAPPGPIKFEGHQDVNPKLWLHLRDSDTCNKGIFVCLLVVAGLLVRVVFFDFRTFDTILFTMPWYDRIAEIGYAALGEQIPNMRGEIAANYSPPYYYLLYVATWFDGLLPKVYLTKAVILPFDFLAAYFAYRIVRLRSSSSGLALLAATSVIFAPTVIANGAAWGQSDIIYSAFLLGSLYFSMLKRPAAVMVLFGIAIAFKAQAVFFAPFLLMLVLRKEIPSKWLFCGPLAYAVMMLPTILLGQSVEEVLTVYLRQGLYFHSLSMNAPNLYYFISNEYYLPVAAAGIVVTVVVATALAIVPRCTRADLTPSVRLVGATMFVAMVPFLLPKMHDRYFFAADLVSIPLAFFVPRLWFIPVLFQVSSMMAYIPIFSASLNRTAMITMFTAPAAFLNTITVGLLVVLYWRSCNRPEASLTGPLREFTVLLFALCTALAVWFLGAFFWEKILRERLCPAQGWLGWICEHELSPDLGRAGVKRLVPLMLLFLAAYTCWRSLSRRSGFLIMVREKMITTAQS